MAPGLIVQFPIGKLFNCTLPVGKTQVGCVIVPTEIVLGRGLTTIDIVS